MGTMEDASAPLTGALPGEAASFLNFCRIEKGLAANSLEAYQADLQKFVQFVGRQGGGAIPDVEAVRHYMDSLYRAGLGSRSVAPVPGPQPDHGRAGPRHDRTVVCHWPAGFRAVQPGHGRPGPELWRVAGHRQGQETADDTGGQSGAGCRARLPRKRASRDLEGPSQPVSFRNGAGWADDPPGVLETAARPWAQGRRFSSFDAARDPA